MDWPVPVRRPVQSRPVDRLDSADHAGWVGTGVRISLDGSRLLLGRDRDRIAHGVGNRALSRAKIGDGSVEKTKAQILS
jgi:hypothetical protein